MDITLPTDCGNAPRIGIVGEFAVSWATGDAEAVDDWLTDDASWTLIGEDVRTGSDAARTFHPPFSASRLVVLSIITHGRLASCDGYLDAGSRRLNFSHAFRFASTSKAAKVAELRSYCVETRI